MCVCANQEQRLSQLFGELAGMQLLSTERDQLRSAIQASEKHRDSAVSALNDAKSSRALNGVQNVPDRQVHSAIRSLMVVRIYVFNAASMNLKMPCVTPLAQ